MRIKKLKLKNGYKRFFDLTINLGDQPKRIVALVGPNGCGKSSVLDGMLFHNSPWGGLGNKGHKGHEYHSMNQTPNYDYQNVEIEFSEGSFQAVRSEKQKMEKKTQFSRFEAPTGTTAS